jgi:hypothetical protein
MVAGLLAVLACVTVRARFDDPDMWWHLKIGQVVWTTHTIPTTDTFSFTTHHHAWIPHEWLAQVAIYGAYKWGGYSGLMLWLCFFASAILIAGYFLCTLYSGNAKVSFMGALVVFVFATVGLSIRPQMIGYLLLIFEMILIHLGRTRNPRWFWCLPPLFAVWVNCHGSFFLGIVLAGIVLLSSLFEFRMGLLVSERWPSRARKILLYAAILSVGALFLNPAGFRQVMLPVDFLLHQQVNLASVQEWQPLPLNGQRGIVFLLVLGCGFLLVIMRRIELHLDEVLLLGAGIWLAGSHDRMLFVFGILAAPIFSRLLSTSWDNYDHQADRIWPNAVILGISMLVLFWSFPGAENLAAQTEHGSPVGAVNFIQTHHLSGPMLNDYGDGGYLIWAMPEHPVFIDGRAEVYEWSGVLQEFGDWATLQSDPNALLDKYGIQFCLLEADAPMVRVLPLLRNWKSVYSDGRSVIFIRTPTLIR